MNLKEVHRLMREGHREDAARLARQLRSIHPALTAVYDSKLGEIEGKRRSSVKAGPLSLENLVFVTPTCAQNAAKRRAIEATWGRTLREQGITHYFVLGAPSLQQAARDGQTLYVPCRDDYESLLLKLALAYEWVLRAHPGFTHLFKIDDDCYLNLPRFVVHLRDAARDCDYIGGSVHELGARIDTRWHFGKCVDPRFDVDYPESQATVSYARGGFGYLLSRRSLQLVAKDISVFQQELIEYKYDYEDLRIAKILASHGVAATKLTGYAVAPATVRTAVEATVVYDIANPRQIHKYHRDLAARQLQTGPVLGFLSLAYGSAADVGDTLGFDNIYLVNLRSAIERRVASQWALNREGVSYEVFNAFDGAEDLGSKIFEMLQDRGAGNLARYGEYADRERLRGRKFIESPGAVGYILTYIRLLLDAKSRNFRKVLILEDDVMLRRDFRPRLANLLSSVSPGYKVFHLGASQYDWTPIDIEQAAVRGSYTPTALATCGSFALAIDTSIVDELVEALLAFDGPFDHIPLGEIYRRYPDACHVAFPNLVIPDVTTSFIREARDQVSHSENMRWDLTAFCYPRRHIRIGVVFGQGAKLLDPTSSYPGADILCYRVTSDGVRPMHPGSEEHLKRSDDLAASEAEVVGMMHALPVEALYFVKRSCSAGEIVSEALDQPLRFGSRDGRSREWLRPLENRPVSPRLGLAAVVIPTRGRTAPLVRAIDSVLEQDWTNKEVVVVDENDPGSECGIAVRRHVDSLREKGCPVTLIAHSRRRNGAAARNTGLFSTRAEYISFLDDDDVYLPGRLSRVIKVLAESGPDTGAAYCGYLGWNSKSNDTARYPIDALPRRLLNLEFQSHYVCTATVTYRREAVLSVNGFDEAFRRHQDLEFNIRVLGKWAISAYPEALVEFNPLPPDNANKLFDVDLFDVKLRFLQKFESEMMELGLDIEEIVASHVREMTHFVRDAAAVRQFALKNPSRFSSAYLSTLLAGC